jgi:hypothetical protein
MDDSLPKFILLVPLNYNDGTEVPKEIILDFEMELFALGGGCTNAGTVEGAYQMADGSRQVDQLLQLWIGLPEEYVPELETLVGQLGKKLGQESMYFERTGSRITFIPPQCSGG